eukprot:1118204-Pelagomonas_calceolata.AAC.3
MWLCLLQVQTLLQAAKLVSAHGGAAATPGARCILRGYPPISVFGALMAVAHTGRVPLEGSLSLRGAAAAPGTAETFLRCTHCPWRLPFCASILKVYLFVVLVVRVLMGNDGNV